MAARKKKPVVRAPSIRITLEVSATPAQVFRALTDSKAIQTWSGAPGRVARKAGGRFSMWDGWNTGRVLLRRPPTSLAYTWRTDGWASETADSVVRWKLVRIRTGTRVTLVHSRLPSLREYRDHKGGWMTYFLKPMERYLKTRA